MSKHMNNLSRRFRQAFAKSPKQSRRSRTSRLLRAEQLEGRLLLAGDVFATHLSPATNAQNLFDGNGDGAVSPLDVLLAINYLNDHGSTSVEAMGEDPVRGTMKIDYNADGFISPADPLVVINKLAEGEGTTSIIVSTVNLDKNLLARSVSIDGATVKLSFPEDGWGTLKAGDRILVSNIAPGNGFYTIASVTGTQNEILTLDRATGIPRGAKDIAVGKVITQVSTGEDFLLGIVGDDVQTVPGGPFAVYNDIMFDTNFVTATGLDITDASGSDPTTPNFQFNNFTNSKSGSISTPGLVDEAGAFRGFDAGLKAGPQLVYTVNMRAGNTAQNNVAFVLDPADVLPAHDILLNGQNDNQCTAEHMVQSRTCNGMVMFVNGSINIVSDIVATNDAPPAFIESSTNNTFNVLSNDTVFNPSGTNPTIIQVNGAAVTANQSISLSNGSLTFLGSSKTGNNFSYTPAAGNSTGTSFTYTISNGQTPAATATATVTLTINAIDDRPVIAGPNSLNTNEDTVLALSGFTITDPDSTNITVTLSLSPNSGTLSQTTFSGTPAEVTSTLNTVTFTPLLDSNAPVTLNISASDGISQPGTKAVSITINAENDLPKFTNLPASLTAFLDQTLAIPSFSVSDPDSALTVTLSVDKGMLTRNGTTAQSITITGGPGSVPISGVSYTPPTGVTGSAALTVSVAEGTGTPVSQPAIPISIVPPLLPYAAPDFITIDEGAISGSVDVFSNDLAKSSKANLSITGTSLPIPAAQGTVTQNESTFTYTPPNADFFGTTSFTYTIADSGDAGDGPSTGTVNITVNAVNDPPVITKPTSTPTFAEDSPASAISGLSVTDIDNATVNVSLSVLHGILSAGGQSGSTIQVTNSVLNGLTYKPNANYFGSDTLTISANDGTAPSVTDTVNITITPVNDPPTIVVPGKQSFFTDFDNTFSSIPAPFSIADIDAGNNNVQVDLTIGVGTLTIGSASGVTVTENPGGSNGIRLTGTVSNINTALTSGVKYRTSAPTPTNTPRQLTATVNDLGNTGTLDPALSGAAQVSATKTIDIEVLDFVPIDIIGKVFIDHNANGNRNIGEPEFGGVKVFLSGIDFQGNAVNETAITDEHGNYKFEKLRPNGSSPYTITIEQPAFVRQGASASASLNLDVRGNVTVTGGSLNFSTGGFTPEFADVWDLFALSGGGQGNSSGILFGVQGTQKWSMFAGSGWDLNRFSNARFTPGAGGNSGVLTVFDSATQQDRTANVSTQAGTLTYRGNGADRVYRVIGSSALLGSTSNGANPEGESGDATTNSAAYARGVDSLFAAGGF
jgi:hypothetical protein